MLYGVGTGNYWSADSLGFCSFSSGANTIASGDNSTAMGIHVKASGYKSTAFGTFNTASGESSTAFGYSSIASGNTSTSMGYLTVASGEYSTAIGRNTTASGRRSFAAGNGAVASGFSSFSFGNALASGQTSFAFGISEASGLLSTSFGNSLASGEKSFAIGRSTTASGINSSTSGVLTIASGENSTASGAYSKALAENSTAMGKSTQSNSPSLTVVGLYNDTIVPLEPYTTSTSPLFIVGNGNFINRSNAMVVRKDGKTGIGTHATSDRLAIKSNPGENPFRVQVNGSTKMRIFSNGSISLGSNKTNVTSGDVYVSNQLGLGVRNPAYRLHLGNNATNIYGRAKAHSWLTYSDRRIKSNIVNLEKGLDKIMALRPVSYFQHNSSFENDKLEIAEEGSQQIGFIAQEVYKVVKTASLKPNDESKELWSMDYEKIIPVLVKGMQEQQELIETQKTQLEIQNQKIEEMYQMMLEIKK